MRLDPYENAPSPEQAIIADLRRQLETARYDREANYTHAHLALLAFECMKDVPTALAVVKQLQSVKARRVRQWEI